VSASFLNLLISELTAVKADWLSRRELWRIWFKKDEDQGRVMERDMERDM